MSIGRDTSYNLAAAMAPAVFMLAVIPFYIHAIGPERFGVLAICWTIVVALRFASLGMGPALTYHLATLHEAPPESRSSLVWTALFLAFTASIAGAFLVVGAGEVYFQYFFQASLPLETEVRRALPLLGALVPLAILIGVLNGALQGMHRFGALSSVNILGAALVALAPLAVAVLVSIRLNALILATVAANAAIVIIELAVCAKLVPMRMPARIKRSAAKALLGYGAWMSGTALIAPLVLLLDRLVVGALRGPTAVAAYVLPYNLVQQLILVPASFTGAVLPRLAPLQDKEVQQLQSSSLRWLNGILTPLSICAIALAPPFFHVWIGPALGGTASPVAVILLLGSWLHGIGHIPATIVLGRSRPDLLTKFLLACLLPYVVLLYYATLHFGVIGAAAIWSIRAAFDPVLFAFTRPCASDLRSVATSALLVFCATILGLILSWMSPSYWIMMVLIAAAACYQNREILTSSIGNLQRRFASQGNIKCGEEGSSSPND